MSEIKITENSLENAILRDGLFVSGYVDNSGLGSINASGYGAHAEGYVINSSIISTGKGSFVFGCASTNSIINASEDGAVTMGCADRNSSIISKGYGAVAMGLADKDASINANGAGSFACGYAYKGSINANGAGAHAAGKNTLATGYCSHTEGLCTIAKKSQSHAEGFKTTASGGSSHAEGGSTESSGDYSHTEGYETYAGGPESHAEGAGSLAKGQASHAEGYSQVNGVCAHGEGFNTEVQSGYGAHAEGYDTLSFGDGAHAGGIGTIANQNAMTAIGKYNVSTNTENTLFVVGDGTSNERSDAFRVNSFGSKTGDNSVPSSVQGKVNSVPDVYLGCPIGTIVMWAGEKAPNGWLLCNGSSLNNSGGEYNNLFDVIGTNYGGNDKRSFDLPNLQQRFPIGAEIGGVGNITNKGTLNLKYTNVLKKTYEGTIKIGQFLNLTNVSLTNVKEDGKHANYYVIVGIKHISMVDSIYVNKCDKFGKITDKTTEENLFDFYNLQQMETVGAVTGILILENEYSTILGSTGGEETHTLTADEIKHKHNLNDTYDNGDNEAYGPQTNDKQIIMDNNSPHNNIPPFLAINFIIKYK